MNFYRIFILFICSLYSQNFTLYHDNDSFFGEDSEYVSGVKLEYITLTKNNDCQINWSGISLIQQIFLPYSTGSIIPPLTERPYAGWLAVGLSFGREKPYNSKRFTASIGVTGEPSLAEHFHREYHKLFDLFTPVAWDSQIDTELTLNVFYDEDWRIFSSIKDNWYLDAWLGSSIALGNFQTSLGGQAVIRIGWYKSKIPTYTNFRLRQTSSFRHFESSSLSLYFSSEFNYRQHYLPLDGLVFGDDLVSNITVNPFIVETSIGILANFSGGWSLGLSYTWRSLEYEEQRTKRPYVNLSISFNF